MDIQEINIGELNELPPLNVIEKNDGSSGNKSVNFGPGADLLMNKQKQKNN